MVETIIERWKQSIERWRGMSGAERVAVVCWMPFGLIALVAGGPVLFIIWGAVKTVELFGGADTYEGGDSLD